MEQTIQWREPTRVDVQNFEGQTPLKYVVDYGYQKFDNTYDDDGTGDLTVTIDSSGCLIFSFYMSTPSFHYEDPNEEQTTIFYHEFMAVQTAKDMAELMMPDILAGRACPAFWDSLGFVKDVV